MRRHTLVPLVLVMGLLAACSGDDATTEAQDTVEDALADAADGDTGSAEDAAENAQELADDIAEDLEQQQAAAGGGSATVTIDGETWEFDSILCAFGEEEIGQEGAELVVSATADGLQFYVSVDSFGDSISLNDIEDFENPSVSWDASEFGGAEVTIEADGKDVTGSSDSFISEVTDTQASGSFEATCP